MPRKPRRTTVVPDAPHHIILRGNNRRRLFSGPADYHRFLHFLLDASRKYGCPLHALCLMPNHVHLLVHCDGADSLGSFVKHFAQRYAQYRNKRRGASGKLFEERYISLPVTSEDQLATLTAYIDLNPVRANIAPGGRPEAYRWSTAKLHLGLGRVPSALRQLWVPTDWFLGLGPDELDRAEAYSRLLGDAVRRDEVPRIHQDPAVLAHGRRVERPDRTRAT